MSKDDQNSRIFGIFQANKGLIVDASQANNVSFVE